MTGIAGDVTVNTGSNVTIATNTWNAIDAEAYGGGDVFVTTGTGSMRGTNAIYASSAGGAGTVNVDTSGDLTGFNNSTGGAGHGIWAVTSSLGGIDITTAAGALITADTDGILATNNAVAGGITIDEGSAINAANGNGIEAVLTAAGNNDGISLTNHAIVSGQTNGASLTTAGTGPIDVTNSGTLQGQDGVGLSAQTTSGAIGIDTSGLVMASVAGVSLSGGAAQLDNAGTIRNLSGLSTDLAIQSDGGATAISNTSLVTGTVDLGDFGNSFTNSGIWETANGTNSFGALTLGNSVMNTGTIIASNDPAAVQMTVFSGLGTFTNAGSLTMQDGLAGDRTVVSGNYVGQGGTVLLDTYLGADGSPSDLLHIQGNTAGSSFLRVANAGGPGALTTSDGIQVVQVDGASDGLFSLVSDYEIAGQRAVVGGAYAYTLWKNGVTTPTDGDWYLRSQLTNPVIPGEPEPPVDPGEPTPPEGPLYQAGVPSYEAYPQVLQSLNRLPTLQQRLRNRYWSAAGNVVIEQGDGPGIAEATPSADGSVFIEGRGVWGRIEGVHSRFDPKVSTSSTDYDIDTFWMQAGLDGQFYESDAGRLIGGITVHYGHATADVSSFYGNGDIDTDGYGFGGNLTWYGTNGFYIDGQAEVTWYDSDLSSQLAERNLVEGNNGIGYALSLETGKRVQLDGNWTITPQVQLVYSAVDFDSFNDPFGARVSLDRGDSLNGRLGLSIDRENSWYGDNSLISRSHIYGIANLYYEFLDGSRVDVDGTKFTSRDNRLWGGVGVGGSYNWNDDKYSIYGEGAINTSLADFGDSYALKGTVGFRVKW